MGKIIILLATAVVAATTAVVATKKKKEENAIIEIRKCKNCDTQLTLDNKGKLCVSCKAEQSAKIVDGLKTAGTVAAVFVGGAILAGLSGNDEEQNDFLDYDYLPDNNRGTSMNFSKKWLKNATDDELDSEREKVRERYVSENIDINEANRLYHTLHNFDDEMTDRANSKYEKEHPNAEPRHREHGWYLPNDD